MDWNPMRSPTLEMTNSRELPAEPLETLLDGVRSAELVVGILTLNNAATVETIVKAVTAGLRQHFEGRSAVVVACDAGSQDGTPELVERAAAGGMPVRLLSLPSPRYTTVHAESGFPGSERAFRMLCAATARLSAAGCLVLEGDIRSVSPEWMDLLGRPVCDQGLDYVVPLWRRHKYDGTLTNGLIYPLNRALYGKRVRYSSGGAYGLSGKLAGHLLGESTWEAEAARYGIDTWMTTAVVAEGFQVCHAFLGPKVRETKPGSLDLPSILAQTVGCIFHQMERYQDAWEKPRGSVDVAAYGPPYVPGEDTLPVQVERMVSGFRQGLRDLLPVWEIILAPDTLAQVLSLGIEDIQEFRFPTDLWVKTVYDFALAYHDRVLHREHLLKSLTPLYLGRTASLIEETRDGGAAAVEGAVEQACVCFEQTKSYLMERWRWQDE